MTSKLNEIEKSILILAINSKDTLNIKEASIYSGYSVSHLRLLNKRGTLHFSQPSGKYLFIGKKELDNFLQNFATSSLKIEQLVKIAS